QVSPLPKPQNSLPPLPLYDQPPTSPLYSPDKTTPQYFPRSPSGNENNMNLDSPGTSHPTRSGAETFHSKLRPVRAAPPPPIQSQKAPRRSAEKTEDVEITLV
ncbi:hypothetical protein GDO86_020537, partial [Hymenochirus boettgeri]